MCARQPMITFSCDVYPLEINAKGYHVGYPERIRSGIGKSYP
ncbi:MAG: hypothetical protein ACKOYP_04125 [Bacteroidota bacterium]